MNLNLNVLKLTHVPLAGQLKYYITNWEIICKDPWILQAVRAYHLDFLEYPHQEKIPLPRSFSQEEIPMVEKEVQEMLQKGAIHMVPLDQTSGGFVSHIFLVPRKGGGQRPVINLKNLNQFLRYEHFKMEGIHMLRDLLKKGDYMVKLDLKDAYFTVPIWVKHQKFLRFFWKENRFEFACLPFGLASAPRVFTKIMKPVVALLRQLGIRTIVYLDDLLIMAKSQDLAKAHVTTALNLLEGLGFSVNYDKSVLTPTTKIKFLGFLVDSITLTLSLPQDKVKKVKKECQQLLNNPTPTIQELSKLLGHLTSSIQAVFPAPLHFHHLQADKNSAFSINQNYAATIKLSPLAMEELLWWRDNLEAWNGKALITGDPDLIIETNASR